MLAITIFCFRVVKLLKVGRVRENIQKVALESKEKM